MEQLRIESTTGKREGIRILRLSGAFTLKNLFDFQALFRGLTDPIVVIDLTEVPYMDSASVGAIMSVHTSCQRNKRQYALTNVCERILSLFQVVGIDGLLVMYPSVEEAQEKLGSKAASI
jgi:anti-sigma B factor antagonist